MLIFLFVARDGSILAAVRQCWNTIRNLPKWVTEIKNKIQEITDEVNDMKTEIQDKIDETREKVESAKNDVMNTVMTVKNTAVDLLPIILCVAACVAMLVVYAKVHKCKAERARRMENDVVRELNVRIVRGMQEEYGDEYEGLGREDLVRKIRELRERFSAECGGGGGRKKEEDFDMGEV